MAALSVECELWGMLRGEICSRVLVADNKNRRSRIFLMQESRDKVGKWARGLSRCLGLHLPSRSSRAPTPQLDPSYASWDSRNSPLREVPNPCGFGVMPRRLVTDTEGGEHNDRRVE